MADVQNKRLLIVGAGSIGERHVRTFRQLGLSVAVVDGSAARASEIAARYGCSSWYPSLREAPLDQFGAAVIATPGDTHIPIARTCMEAGLHLLVEKPLSNVLDGAAEIIAGCHQRKLTLSIAYVLRFHPIVERVRQICQQGTLGQMLSLHEICHHHLPTSRPDYLQTYYASAAGGGGVVLDLSHEVNYAEWLLGPLRLLNCRVVTVGELGIPGEAIADISLESENSIPIQIHLHAADHQNRRECHIAGSRASLTANLLTGEIVLYRAYDQTERIQCTSERDSWHLAQAKNFLHATVTQTSPRCTGEEGLQTLQLCLQILSRGSRAE